eukprot:COSAG05_NODE_3953_length_1753_cov_3.051995_1_plen_297_part_10
MCTIVAHIAHSMSDIDTHVVKLAFVSGQSLIIAGSLTLWAHCYSAEDGYGLTVVLGVVCTVVGFMYTNAQTTTVFSWLLNLAGLGLIGTGNWLVYTSLGDSSHDNGYCDWLHVLMRRSKIRSIQLAAETKQQQRRDARDMLENLDRLDSHSHFSEIGFEDRVSISLNAVVPHSDGCCTFDLRTMTTMPLQEFLPSQAACKMISSATKWTDVDGLPQTYDPYVSLSEHHANGSNSHPTHSQRAVHSMIVSQIRGMISSTVGSSAHLGIDQKLHFRQEKYVWYVHVVLFIQYVTRFTSH